MPPSPYSEADMRTVWSLIWPQTVMMMLQFGISFVCVWVAGHLTPLVQASFGMIAQCVMFLQVLAVAVGSAAVAAVSQSLGAGMERRARRYVITAGCGSLLLGVAVALAGYLFRVRLFDALMAPDQARAILDDYWFVTLLSVPFNYVWIVSSGFFRAMRRVMDPLWVSLLVFVAVFFGSLGFGLGRFGLPNLGYMGIAWASFLAVVLGALCNVLLLRRLGYLRLHDAPSPRWVRRAGSYLLRVAWPAGLSQFLWQLGYLVIFSITASLPAGNVEALAGLTAGIRIEALLFMPAFAFNMTASVLVGNSLGAGDRAGAARIAVRLCIVGCVFVSCAAALMWPFRPELAALLSDSPAVREQTVSYLFYNLLAAPFTAVGMILGGVMVGAGATRYNLMVFAGVFWLLRLPLAWFFGHVLWGESSGIFLSMLVSQIVQACLMSFVLKRLDWTGFCLVRHPHTFH